MIIDKSLKQLYFTLFYENEKVFSGAIDELSVFIKEKGAVDRVEVSGADGVPIASMAYAELMTCFTKV